MKRPSREQTELVLLKENGSISASTTYYVWKNNSGQKVRIDKCTYINPTGLAVDTSNYFALAVKQGSVSVATYSTHDNALTAATYADLALSSSEEDLIIENGESITFVATKTGTQTLPAGTLQILGRFIGA